MDCQHPMALLHDEELFNAVLDDEALPEEKRRHLASCEICRKQVDKYKSIDKFLLSALYRTQCISSMELNTYCVGLVSAERRDVIERHLQACPLCANEVEQTKRFLHETQDRESY